MEQELDGCAFPDQRLKARLGKLLGDLGRRIGGTVPAACQDWAATRAAYRFFSNPRVGEGVILAGHFAATTARFAATPGTVLVLHDTTEFSFTRDTPDGIGQLSFVKGRHVKRTAKLKEQAGLFAEYVEPVTAEQVITAAERHRDRFRRCLEEQQAKGDAARSRIAELVGPEELAALDARRAVLPSGPEYHADLFCRELQRLLAERGQA